MTYAIERELDGGGMSRVYLAEDRALGRRVVIKVLAPGLAAELSAERFAREVRLAASLQHPHIVPVLNAGDADGVPYYTMPFVEGQSLRERLAGGPLPVSDALSILRDVAKALEFAHGKHVVHRDIKPGNILLAGNTAAVTDFGIAKAIAAASTRGGPTAREASDLTLTEVGISLGTPAYMAPEQATGDPNVDHRADIYAFGCVAYEVFSGAPPFGARSTHQLVAAHVAERPEPLSNKRPDVPASIDALVARCLAKSPDERPQTATELIDVLSEPTSGRFATTNVFRSPRRRALAGVAVVALLVLGGAVYGLVRGAGTSAAATPTIAVVPLDQPRGDTAQRYLTDGVADEVTSALAGMPVLQVAARASAYAFRGTVIDAKRAASQLGVQDVLELAIQRRGDTLHVNADLVNGRTGLTRWSRTANYDLRNLATIQDSIAGEVVGALRVHGAPRGTHHQPPREAAELYLRGRYATAAGGKDDLLRAVEFFRRARQIDTAYAQAYASEASVWAELSDAYLPPYECYPRADTLSMKALALDSTIAEAYANMAWVDALFVRDLAAAEAKFRHAISLVPNDALSHNYYSQLLMFSGRFAEARHEDDISIQLDPPNVWYLELAVAVYGFLDRPDSAIAAQARVDAIAPGAVYGEAFVTDAWRMKHEYRTAFRLDSAAAVRMGHPTAGLVLSLIDLGRRDEAERVFHQMEAARERMYFPAEVPARAALALGHRDRALYWFRRGFDEHSTWGPFTQWLPDVRPFRKDPEYAQLIRRMGFKS